MADPRESGYSSDDLARAPGRDDPDDYRHPFARDYDRLVHTSAFRRLQGKTGVVAPGEADFFRTRLTHTIEVSQLSRRLGWKLGAHPDVVEAAAVMHDFGHAPFGHVGEESLSDAVDRTAAAWGLDPAAVGGYEGNAQTFRLVTTRLVGSSAKPGLHLTRATLDAATKYPWQRGEVGDQKWCFYPTELEQAAWMREPVPAERQYTQSFEAQVMEWADDVAYAIHDLEDFCLAGLLPLALLTQSASARESTARQLVARRRRRGKLQDTDTAGLTAAAGVPSNAPDGLTGTAGVPTNATDGLTGTAGVPTNATGALAGAAGADSAARSGQPRYTADELVDAFERIFTEDDGPFEGFRGLAGEFDGSTQSRHAVHLMRKRLINRLVHAVAPRDSSMPPRRHFNDLAIPKEARLVNDVLRDLLWVFVIEHPRMATYQHGQRRVVNELFEIYAASVRADDTSIFPRDLQAEIDGLRAVADHATTGQPDGRGVDTDVEVLRLIADHVGQMTDDAAARMHRRLTGHGDRVFSDFL